MGHRFLLSRKSSFRRTVPKSGVSAGASWTVFGGGGAELTVATGAPPPGIGALNHQNAAPTTTTTSTARAPSDGRRFSSGASAGEVAPAPVQSRRSLTP